jgi:hypothetical protein
MRRGFSIFVLLILLVPLALPLTLAGGAPALPVCCRPGGTHHCTGRMASQTRPGDGFRDAPHNCPFAHARLLPDSLRPQAPVAVAVSQAFAPLQTALVTAGFAAPAAAIQSPRAPPARSSL